MVKRSHDIVFVAQARMMKVMQIVSIILHHQGVNAKQLADQVDTSVRTIYRYLTLIEACGANVTRRKRGGIYIDKCPFCQSSIKH